MFGGGLDYSTGRRVPERRAFLIHRSTRGDRLCRIPGATVVAGEEEARTLDQLLANPVPRWRILIEKGAAIIIGIAVLGVMFWSALVVGAKDRRR